MIYKYEQRGISARLNKHAKEEKVETISGFSMYTACLKKRL